MVKVKLVKLTDEMLVFASDEEKARVGNTYEAFFIKDEYQQREDYQEMYALNLGNNIWFVPIECCEVLYDTNERTISVADDHKTPTAPTDRILLVEEGSVDIDKIEELGITCIAYRQGSNKPEWL